MDRVVQQNAANAEESASASKELRAQAQLMQTFIARLLSLVEGADRNVTRPAGGSGEKNLSTLVKSKAAGKAERISRNNGGARKANLPQAGPRKVEAAALIPFDGEDVSDF